MKSEKDRTANQNVFRVLNSIIFPTILLTAAILGAAISVSIFDTKSVYADNTGTLEKVLNLECILRTEYRTTIPWKVSPL